VNRFCAEGSLLRRSKIFIAFDVKNCASSVGATNDSRTITPEYAAPTELAMIWVSASYKDVAPTELVRFSVATLAMGEGSGQSRAYDRGSCNTARMSDTIFETSASFSLPYKSSNLPEGFTRYV
jgi:hypothetical protein